MPNIFNRFQNAWNAFLNRSPTGPFDYTEIGRGYSYKPDRLQMSRGNERSIINSVYNRISNDVASIAIRHVRLDQNGKYKEDMPSGLNNCLRLEANIDQTYRSFIQDICLSMLDEGAVCVFPVDADVSPDRTQSYDIYTMRTGKILEWRPNSVKINAYDDRDGTKKDIVVPKVTSAIIESPFYSILNAPNSTMQRLIRKLNILDAIDEQSGAGKLDLVISLPYAVHSEARKKQAEERRSDIERQLAGSKYGIAYTDGTEKITQLNRSVDNNMMHQIEYLTEMLYSQMGITQSVLDGTADENVMANYYSRTIEPILTEICTEMKRKFLSKTARSQGQSIEFFRDPFKLMPVTAVADSADKFTRNEILTSNEFRQILGMKPSDDPEADELRNKNLNKSEAEIKDDPQKVFNEEGGIDDEV